MIKESKLFIKYIHILIVFLLYNLTIGFTANNNFILDQYLNKDAETSLIS